MFDKTEFKESIQRDVKIFVNRLCVSISHLELKYVRLFGNLQFLEC